MQSRAPWSIKTLAPWVGLAVLFGMRMLWLGAYPLDSDEPQHAHVAWSLAQGSVLYGGVFDNHGPLFALLYAVFMHGLGPRADILWWLRLAVIPWYFLALWATWQLARRLYSRAIAHAAVVLTALMQIFFIKMGEFRTDDLWTALWLSALALAVYAGRSPWRWSLAGLCTGAALSVSQKTSPLLAVALIAAAGVWMTQRPPFRGRLMKPSLAAAGGALLVPSAILVWLAHQRDLPAAWYDLVGYGLAPTGGPSHVWRQACYALLVVLVMTLVIGRLRHAQDLDGSARWRIFLGLHGLLYALLIWIAWPLSTPQDFLPVIPTLLLSLAGVAAPWAATRVSAGSRTALVGAFATLELVLLVHHAPPWRDALASERSRVNLVLQCTAPSDTVMDAKSGAIFRPRPYYPVLESIALRRLQHGLMPDTISQALIAHRTMVVVAERLPSLAAIFVSHNYLAGTAGISMAGTVMPASMALRQLTIRLPGTYVLTDGTRPLTGSMDGGVPASQWSLGSGPHRLVGPPGRKLALIWSRGWACGWRPTLPSPKHP